MNISGLYQITANTDRFARFKKEIGVRAFKNFVKYYFNAIFSNKQKS